MHLENPPVPIGPRYCPFPDFARNPEKIPPSFFTFNRISSTGSAVCISKTHLCRSDPDFTILLFYYFTNFTRTREFAAGPTQILLFYYFTILREIGSLHLENPPVPVGPRIYRFTDFARNPEKIPPCLFTFNRISSTGSAVCISKSHLCRSDPDFTNLLFTNFTGNQEFASRKPTCAGWTRFPDFARNPEKIPPSLFTFNRISSTGSAVCISKTHLCRSDPDFTILLFYYFTILLFYYFTILLFYYFTILLFYYFRSVHSHSVFSFWARSLTITRSMSSSPIVRWWSLNTQGPPGGALYTQRTLMAYGIHTSHTPKRHTVPLPQPPRRRRAVAHPVSKIGSRYRERRVG